MGEDGALQATLPALEGAHPAPQEGLLGGEAGPSSDEWPSESVDNVADAEGPDEAAAELLMFLKAGKCSCAAVFATVSPKQAAAKLLVFFSSTKCLPSHQHCSAYKCIS